MKYSDKTKPGMADPYWYEWSVGQLYIVDMLNPDSHIQYVELQKDVQLGLDDVVVTYDDGTTRFIQVKHTRAEDTLTFGDLVSTKETKSSLLGELASSWGKEKDNYIKSEVYIFTNRRAGDRAASAGTNNSIKRPPLTKFYKELQKKVTEVDSFEKLQFEGYEEAWKEWCEQLSGISNNADKLLFLRSLYIETEQSDLGQLGNEIKDKLKSYLLVSDETAEILLSKLDHALRDWTVSSRKSSRITVEELYSALSAKENVISYNHDIIPVNPFFSSRQELVDRLELSLQKNTQRVIYLSGVPGTGKTNIVSKLCCKKDSIIDIRYYAYEPIDPGKEYLPADVSDRVDRNVFWDTLLNQLREILRGQLYRYRVPVSTSFMRLEDKRREFFRIASEFASNRGRAFVIAIDGLDHAARAGIKENTFLPSLPNPEYIPDNVEILIAGQPKEYHGNYPDWLFSESSNIKEFEVTNIQKDDIKSLVDEKCHNLSESNKAIVTDIVCKYAGGNTLAAIFAVHEAVNCDDPAILDDRLRERKLSGNIQEYYKQIWEDAKKKMQIPFVDYKMAGVFAFFNEAISASKLNMIFKEEGISTSAWNNVLKALSPLLQEKNGLYTILHNDVRVYLSSIIGRDVEHVKEIYSGLVNYYISLETKNIGYYRDIFRFLISAGRISEFKSIFSPEYVIEAYVNGIELDVIRKNTDELMRFAISETPLDWDNLRCLTMGYLTIEQIDRSSDEILDATFRKTRRSINVQPYECYITPAEKWNVNILLDVLQLVDNLFENNEIDRGENLFLNWFDDASITEVIKILNDEDKDHYSGNGKKVADLLAKACVNCGNYKLLCDLSTVENKHFIVEFVEQAESLIIEKLHGRELEEALNSLDILLIEPIIVGIKKLLDANRFEDITAIRQSLQRRKVTNPMSKLLLTFLKIITGTVDWEVEDSVNIWEEIESVKLPDEEIENLMAYYSVYALVAAYLQDKSRSIVANEVTNMYIAAHKYQKPRYFLLYFNAVSYLGKWLKSRNENKHFYESVDDLKQIIRNLYCKKWKHSETDFETFNLRAYILKAYILLVEKEDEKFKWPVECELDNVFIDNPVNQLMDPGMLLFRNNTQRMQSWIDEWLADDGKVWTEPLGERNSIIKKFTDAKEKYDYENALTLRGAIDKVKWSIIGFASNKEYCVNNLLNWYNKLVDKNPEFILKYSEYIKNISDQISVLGDNRMDYTLDCKIYSDMGSLGDSQILNMLKNRRIFSQSIAQPSYLVEMIIGYLKEHNKTKEQLLFLWSVGIGLLDWKVESDYSTIVSLQRAIEKNAARNGIVDIRANLSELGPAYVDLTANPVLFEIPDRWCDDEEKSKDVEDSNRIIEAYYNNDKDSPKNHEVSTALKTLYYADSLSDEQVEHMLSYEIRKSSYGLRGNSIIEFLLEIGTEQAVDKAVTEFIHNGLNSYFYPAQDLPLLIGWRLWAKGKEYTVTSLDDLISTINCWMTAANNIKAPTLDEGYDYSNYYSCEDKELYEVLVEILLMIIVSEDADAARTALGGLAACLRVDKRVLYLIENSWGHMHYRAKEWILMIYELVYMMCPDSRAEIYNCLVKHSKDDDFNVALYASILCENIDCKFEKNFSIEEKEFFADIPEYSQKRLIKTKRTTPWITGYDCVMEQIERLEKRLNCGLEDLERRTASYSNSIDDDFSLLPLNRQKSGGCLVVCDQVNSAFFRVLYKDWFEGRWKGLESELARVILSASEPYTLLVSPSIWPWNNNKFFTYAKDVILQEEAARNKNIEAVLQTGIGSDEVVLAGSIEDYTYNQKVFGYLLSYLNIPEMKEQYALPVFERNARLYLLERKDYVEGKSPNISIHQNGIESFKQSNIMCGFRKTILSEFKWIVRFDNGGLKLFDRDNKEVGRFECYYGVHTDIANRNPSNQPYLQRWIVDINAFEKEIERWGCPYEVKTVTASLTENADA